MSDINDKKIQELKDILKDLGFQENICIYEKNIYNRCFLRITFTTRIGGLINIDTLDKTTNINIHCVYKLDSDSSISCATFSFTQFNCFTECKREFIKNTINKTIQEALNIYNIENTL